MHIKFINLPLLHTFCTQKSYCLHKSVSQARPQNRLMSSHPIRKQRWWASNPIGKQYYEYYGTKSWVFYRINNNGIHSILYWVLFYSSAAVDRTSLLLLLLVPVRNCRYCYFVRYPSLPVRDCCCCCLRQPRRCLCEVVVAAAVAV